MVRTTPHKRRWDALIRMRRDAGHTQVSLAKALPLSRTYLIDLEEGRRTGTEYTLKKIADFFGMTVTELDATRRQRGNCRDAA